MSAPLEQTPGHARDERGGEPHAFFLSKPRAPLVYHPLLPSSYIAAAYVKWIESAGGRAVPIRFYVSDEELKRLFASVNGLIFPGGLTDLYPSDPYTLAAGKLYAWAKAANDGGTPFPIWGTCLGHQLMCVLESGAHFQDLFIETDAVSQPAPLTFTDAAPASALFGPLFGERPGLAAAMASAPINMENHEFGLPLSAMVPATTPWPALAAGFKVLATAVDRKGVPYVATIEHAAYPFFGTQWHPEKPPFEFSDRTIPKSHAAMSVSHYLADLFMDHARACPHAPASPEQELADLIYNTKPVFTAREIVMEASYDGKQERGEVRVSGESRRMWGWEGGGRGAASTSHFLSLSLSLSHFPFSRPRHHLLFRQGPGPAGGERVKREIVCVCVSKKKKWK